MPEVDAKCKLVRRIRGFATVGFVLAALGLLSSPARSSTPDSGILEATNLRWNGAICRLRSDHLVKKCKDGDHWSQGSWVWVELSKTKYRVLVSNCAALPRVKRGGLLPAGAELISEGWKLEEPKKGKGLALHLRLKHTPVRVRFVFYGSYFGTLSTKHLQEMEQKMRFDILEIVSAGDELLEDPAMASPTSHQLQTFEKPTPSTAQPVAAPSLHLLAVSLQPTRVAAGDEVNLVLTYDLGSVAPGAVSEVTELREILRNDEQLAAFDQVVHRGAGTFTSTQSLRVPADLSAGYYTFRGSVTMAGQQATMTALFEVVAKEHPAPSPAPS